MENAKDDRSTLLTPRKCRVDRMQRESVQDDLMLLPQAARRSLSSGLDGTIEVEGGRENNVTGRFSSLN